MKSEPLYKCLDCDFEYDSKVLGKCPQCHTLHLRSVGKLKAAKASHVPTASELSDTDNNSSSSSPLWSSDKLRFAREASSSAQVVNTFGKSIQIIGNIIAFIFFCAVVYLSGQAKILEDQGWDIDSDAILTIGVIFGLIGAALISWLAKVRGALFRMLANYIQFKTRL